MKIIKENSFPKDNLHLNELDYRLIGLKSEDNNFHTFLILILKRKKIYLNYFFLWQKNIVKQVIYIYNERIREIIIVTINNKLKLG